MDTVLSSQHARAQCAMENAPFSFRRMRLKSAICKMQSLREDYVAADARLHELEKAELYSRNMELSHFEQFEGEPVSKRYAFGSPEFRSHLGQLARLAAERQCIADDMLETNHRRELAQQALASQHNMIDTLIKALMDQDQKAA